MIWLKDKSLNKKLKPQLEKLNKNKNKEEKRLYKT
jgi:hypothetical protein